MVEDLLTREVKNLKLSPLATNYVSSGTNGNLSCHMNVEVLGSIDAGFTDGFGMAIPCGRQGEGCFIAGVITGKTPGTDSETNPAIFIRVQTPDGQPLPDAVGVGGSPPSVPNLHVKAIHGGTGEFRADESGRVRLPLPDTNLFLVAAGDQGFGWLPNAALTNGATLVIQPWGTLAGVRKNRNHPLANESLRLTQNRDYFGEEVPELIVLSGQETRTDEQGRFWFTSVPPLKLFLDRQEKPPGGWSYLRSVEIQPGEAGELKLDTRGRTVTGRVTLGPGLDTNLDLTACSGWLQPSPPDRTKRQRTFGFKVAADGSLRADGVEPGEYKISGGLRRESDLVALFAGEGVTVPDDLSNAEDVPFDPGSALLKARIKLKPGDLAPEFAVHNLADEPLKLSDFRGEYMRLDFRATWCGPCVGETPNMKATYEAFGHDSRFVMISLSLDATPAEPRKFARDHDLAWTQGVPAIFLIDPAGKVVATGLRGENIQAAAAAALKNQPAGESTA
jgi:thiol-disulfide isomerase/thioredoxin